MENVPAQPPIEQDFCPIFSPTNQIQPDGTLAHRQRYFHIHQPDTADDAGDSAASHARFIKMAILNGVGG